MAMAEEFERAVEDGLRLGKRIYFGKDPSVSPPKPMTAMEKASPKSLLPSSPMMYAVIPDPKVVDNPDMPSYQPYVHGRCHPPALIPLQMNAVALEVDCYLDTAFVTLTGSWRVHCVRGSRCCDCRIAIPMGEQGSILGIEVEVHRKSYHTELTGVDDKKGMEKVATPEDGGFLKPDIFTLTVPRVDGGSNLSITARWSQKLVYCDGQITLCIPYTFPEYVTPAGKRITKKEKIQLNMNAGPGIAVQYKTTSHPLKELKHEVGKFSYEEAVLAWSSSDFVFTYSILTPHVHGGVLLQSPAMLDSDRREIFCCFVYPGDKQSRNVFRKEVVFVVDVSASMTGETIESTKNAIFHALAKLDPQDSFGVIAFSDEYCQFSSSLEHATTEAIEKATQWINMNFIAGGGTNILPPLTQAMEMLSQRQNSIPFVLLITDGAVEDERHICDIMKSQLSNQNTISPRIHTFGIGSFCNHYFLRMLAILGRGTYDAALDLGFYTTLLQQEFADIFRSHVHVEYFKQQEVYARNGFIFLNYRGDLTDSLEVRMEGLFSRASSTILANISFEFEDLNEIEVYPCRVPDLSSQGPLIISGRYQGVFPENLKAKALLADLNHFSLELKVQESKDMLLNKVVAKQQIEILTAQAWFSEDKELEEKIAKVSVLNGIVSEYTQMSLLETGKGTANAGATGRKGPSKTDKTEESKHKIALLRNLGVGFGNVTATADNIPPRGGDRKHDEAADDQKAASNCCRRFCNRCCCCMYCLKACSRINDQCAIVMTQICSAFACLGCFSCCNSCCEGSES